MSRSEPSIDACTSLLASFLEAIADRVCHSTADRVASTELTLSHLRMLLTLSRSDHDLSVNELADAVDLSVAAAGRGADRLVALDLVVRREDETDRRVKRLRLSSRGRELIRSQFAIREGELTDLVAEIPADRRTDFHSGLSTAMSCIEPATDHRFEKETS
ncbi:MarR family winged helix-turn-helix transcriptional regulator [Gordonia shandongensis]|uniref:MarR family winged helix-turn-helix transcriptional regulator n=1 Tax=Gordonia shandongensis TaxID=376351 RepID=UPI0003F9559C|nr:MarR family transcriptional regulator [Gordonia shandongensis]